MHHTFRQRWKTLTHGHPGRRFEDRYEAGKKARSNTDWGNRIVRLLRLVLAMVAVLVGVVLVFIPGPAIVFFFLAGSLLAAESRGVARFLDWSELRLRAIWGWSRRHWEKLPQWGRVAFAAAVACLSALSAYASYRCLTG